MKNKDFFIAIYTHECKSYCDEQFFNNLFQSNLDKAIIRIIDNSNNLNYTEKLKSICNKFSNIDYNIEHIDVSRNDLTTLFLRNVADSVNYLRDKFLKTDCKYFVILESDLLPPTEWLSYFLEVIDKADLIGGVYYFGVHREELFRDPTILEFVHHVLSGCTLYKREVIEKLPFRWSTENLNAFPDAWMSADSTKEGFKLANYSKIKCDHLHRLEPPFGRGHNLIS